jgi:hypothetical protein
MTHVAAAAAFVWIPAFAGMTMRGCCFFAKYSLKRLWAFAGVTKKGQYFRGLV